MTDSFRPTVLRGKAWEALAGKWGRAAIAMLLLYAVSFAASIALGIVSIPFRLLGSMGLGFFYFIGMIALMIVLMLCAVGLIFTFRDVAKGADVVYETIAEPLKDWKRYLAGVIRVFVYVFLWSLLLYIPGIIKAISYSQTYFIMRDNPGMKGEEAINLSMKMMHGHKMDLFLLGLSFIGWILLGSITFGIGLLWVYPYIHYYGRLLRRT